MAGGGGGRAQHGASAGTSGRGAAAAQADTTNGRRDSKAAAAAAGKAKANAKGKAKAEFFASPSQRIKSDSDDEFFDILPTAPLFDEAMKKAKHSRRELAALGGDIDAALGASFAPRGRRAGSERTRSTSSGFGGGGASEAAFFLSFLVVVVVWRDERRKEGVEGLDRFVPPRERAAKRESRKPINKKRSPEGFAPLLTPESRTSVQHRGSTSPHWRQVASGGLRGDKGSPREEEEGGGGGCKV